MITLSKKIAAGIYMSIIIGSLLFSYTQVKKYRYNIAPTNKLIITIESILMLDTLKQNFQDSIARSESNSKYNIRGGYNNHYLGKYQLGRSAFRDIFEVTYNIDKDGKRIPDFSKGDEQYEWAQRNVELGNWKEADQDICFEKWVAILKVYLEDEIKAIDEIKEINGIQLTESGLIAAAHLCGSGAVKKFINSDGRVIAADANDVRLTEYLEKFAGYDC